MRLRYSAFGLNLEVNRPVPGLVPAARTAAPTVRVDLSVASGTQPSTELGRPSYVSPFRGPSGMPTLQMWRRPDGWHRLRYDDGTQFLIDRSGSRVRGRWPENFSIDDTAPYLLGPVLGFVLRLKGMVCLHASVVQARGTAVALLGSRGAGKSTAAAAFAKLGVPVISDDIAALEEDNGGVIVRSAYPWVRLWPSAAEMLFGSAEALPRIAPEDPSWNKRFLDLTKDGYRFETRTVPLGVIYHLATRSDESRAPYVRQISGHDKLHKLVANTYMSHLLDPAERGREFEFLSRLTERVAVREVVPSEEASKLPRLCEVILEDLERHPPVPHSGWAASPAMAAQSAAG